MHNSGDQKIKFMVIHVIIIKKNNNKWNNINNVYHDIVMFTVLNSGGQEDCLGLHK